MKHLIASSLLITTVFSQAYADHHLESAARGWGTTTPSGSPHIFQPSASAGPVASNLENINEQLQWLAWRANALRENARQADAAAKIMEGMAPGTAQKYDLYKIDRGGHGHETFYGWVPSDQPHYLEQGAKYKGSRIFYGAPTTPFPGTPAPYTLSNPPIGFSGQGQPATGSSGSTGSTGTPSQVSSGSTAAQQARQEARALQAELRALRQHQEDLKQFKQQGGAYRAPALGSPGDVCPGGHCGDDGRAVNPDYIDGPMPMVIPDDTGGVGPMPRFVGPQGVTPFTPPQGAPFNLRNFNPQELTHRRATGWRW